MSKRILWIVLGGVVLGGIVWAVLPGAVPVGTEAVDRGEVTATVEERAETTLPRTWRVGMPIDGRVLPIELGEGDAVEEGQVVARLEATDLESAVAEAKARLEAVEARLAVSRNDAIEKLTLDEHAEIMASIRATLKAAKEREKASDARLEYAEWWLATREETFAAEAATLRDLKEARKEEVEARVALTTDRLVTQALDAARSAAKIYPSFVEEYLARKRLEEAVLERERDEARARLERARDDLDRAVLRSPIDGVVLERHVDDRRWLPAGSPLLDIGDLDALEVTADVLTREAVTVRPGDEAVVDAASIGGEHLPARVDRIDPRAFTKVSSLGVEEQRVEVVLRPDPEAFGALRAVGHPLGVGFRVRVRIVTERRDDALRVPRGALFRGEEAGWKVWVVRDGRAERLGVEVGILDDEDAEIIAGLEEGDRVVIAPGPELAPEVRVREEER